MCSFSNEISVICPPALVPLVSHSKREGYHLLKAVQWHSTTLLFSDSLYLKCHFTIMIILQFDKIDNFTRKFHIWDIVQIYTSYIN